MTATVQSIDARLSAWGHAVRRAVSSRVEAIAEGAVIYAGCVQRDGAGLPSIKMENRQILLMKDEGVLLSVASDILPNAIENSCRLLCIDSYKLRVRVRGDLYAFVDAAHIEVRRIQALYRRRARLDQNNPARLEHHREKVEALRIPACGVKAAERVALCLLLDFQSRHPKPRRAVLGELPDLIERLHVEIGRAA